MPRISPASARRPGPQRRRVLIGTLAALWLAIAAGLVLTLRDGGQDDAFIIYRYAANLAAGDGLVYNSGERAFGITEPGYGLLLGGLHVLTGIPIPWLGTSITGLALVAAALLLVAEGRRVGTAGAAAGATLVVAGTQIWICHGFAGPLSVAACLAAAALAERRPAAAGALVGLAVWTRPDAGLAALALGVLLWRRRRTLPWRYGVASGVVILTGLATAFLYYGTPLPTTLAAKRAMAEAMPAVWGGGWHVLRGFADGWRFHLAWAAVPVAALALPGTWRAWRDGGPVSRTLLLYAAGVGVAYPLIGVGFYPWYLLPLTAALLFAAGIGAGWCGETLATLAGRDWKRAAAAAATLALVAAIGVRVARLANAYAWPSYLATYRRAAAWLGATAQTGDAVALYEVGVVGYYSGLRVVDLLGLVTPEAMAEVRSGRIGLRLREQPTTWAVDHSRRTVGGFTRLPWFAERYRAEARFADPAGGEVVVYRLRTASSPGG